MGVWLSFAAEGVLALDIYAVPVGLHLVVAGARARASATGRGQSPVSS